MENPFDAVLPSYARVRPGYPADAVDLLLAAAGAATESGPPRVADIGAGTGKMTELLLARGCRVDAVEPSASMRAQLRAAALVPGRGTGSRTAGGGGLLDEGGAGLTIRATTAEATGLDDASVDLVVYAQSWHWVDAGLAGAEAARILAPGGAIAAVWNQMDVSDPWVRRLTRIMRSGDVHRVDDPPAFGPAFTAPRLHQVRWTDRMTRAELMDLGTTRSSYLRQDAAGRARMQENLRWYLWDHPGARDHMLTGEHGMTGDHVRLAIPYTTLVWTAAQVQARSGR